MVRKTSSTRTWLPWVGLALVAALAIAYCVLVMVAQGGPQTRANEPFEASRPPACLTRPTLRRFEHGAIDLEKALTTVVRIYDDYAKDAESGSSAGAMGGDPPSIPGEEGEGGGLPSIPGEEGEGTAAFAGSLMGGGRAGLGGEDGTGGLTSTSTGPSVPALPSAASFEGFVDGKAVCIRDPTALKNAQTQYKERPLALLKVYNTLRTRVNKGIEGLARRRRMMAQAKAQERLRAKQTKAIQQAGEAQEASLNDYYNQGGSA